MTDSPSTRSRTGRVCLLATLTLLLASRAYAQEQDLALTSLRVSAPNADLSLPDDRGRIDATVVVGYDPDGAQPDRVVARLALVTQNQPLAARFDLGEQVIDPRLLQPHGMIDLRRAARLSVDLSDADVRAFVVSRGSNNLALEVTIAGIGTREPRIGGLPNVATAQLPRIRPLSGALRFGVSQAAVRAAIADDAGCGPNGIRVPAGAADLLPSPNGLWDATPLAVDACTTVRGAGASYDLLAAAGYDEPLPVTGRMGGNPVTVIGVLRTDGYIPVLLAFERDDLTVHAPRLPYPGAPARLDAPRPLGVSTLAMSVDDVAFTSDFATVTATRADTWLRARDLPFALRLPQLRVNQDGVEGDFDRVHPFNALPRALTDRRTNPRFRASNTHLFDRPAPVQPDPTVRLLADGLEATVRFQGGVGRTHFPETFGLHGDFDVRIRGGELAEVLSIPFASFSFTQSGDCPGCGAEAENDTAYALAADGAVGLSQDGARLVRVTGLPDGPGFGPLSMRNGQPSPVFKRFEDGDRGVLQIPGYRALGTDSSPDVTAYLLASRELAVVDELALPGRVHAFDAHARRGNYFFPGVTVGPEIYSDLVRAQPQVGDGVDLTDARMWIGFGGASNPDWRIVAANLGTKYVVRRGGLTGVFNTDAAPQPQLYGYPTRLTRFGFRVVSNALDDRTWIDGRIDVPGRGGFGLDVLDLDLRCTAQVDAGALAGRDCAAGINCDQSLAAWRAPYDIGGFSFPPADGDQCDPAPRVLRTAGITEVHALTKPIGLTSTWDNAGDPINALVTGGAENEVDGTPGAPGFNVVLQAGVTLDSPANRPDEGWFTFRTLSPVPFWDAMRAVIRAENDANGGARRTVLIRDTGLIPDAFADQTNLELADDLEAQDGWRPIARYRWGGSAFTLDFPMRYAGKTAPADSPRFLGDSVQGFDLKVLSARAGSDWISPDGTRISFGASADFDRVRAAQVDLHLDLNDPNSVARADAFLDEVLPGNQIDANGDGPIARVLGVIRNLLPSLMKYTGAGFDNFLEEALREAFDNLPVRAIIDAASNTLNRVQALPGLLTQGLLDGPRVLAAEIEARFSLSLVASVEFIWQTLPAVGARVNLNIQQNIPPAQPDLDALSDVVRAMLDLLAALTDVESKFNALLAELDRLQAEIDNLEAQAHAAVADARAELQQLRNLVDPDHPNALPIFDCQVGGGANVLLGRITQIRQRVEQITDVVANNTLVQLAIGLASLAGIDMSAVQAAQTELADAANDLQTRVVNGVAAVERSINDACADIRAAGTQATQLVDRIDAGLIALDQAFTTYMPDLQALTALSRQGYAALQAELIVYREIIVGWVDGIEATLEDGLRLPFEGAEIDIREQLDLLVSPRIPGGRFYVSAEVNFVTAVRARLIVPVDTLVNSIILAVQGALAEALEGVITLPSSDELIDMLVSRIMASDAVAAIDRAVHDNMVFVFDAVDGLVTRLLDQINFVVKEVSTKLTEQLNAALEAAAGVLNELPIASARMDGFATIRGEALERLHIDAEWTMRGDGDDNSSTYAAAFDMTSWAANGKGANCDAANDGAGVFDIKIAAFNLPMSLAGAEAIARQVFLGFTLDGILPVAVFGGIDIMGDFDFEAFQLYDLGLQAGVGRDETYVGAKGGASFDGISLEAAFLVGVTCNTEVLQSLDPQIAEFLDLQEGFRGGYVRGGASIPVWDNGCALTVGVSADAGAWLLWESAGFRFGGLLGGSAWGEALCIAALRGGVTTYAELNAGTLRFGGDGYGVAGLGFDCDPHTWTSVSRSRGDSWCGTGDAQFGVTYTDGEGFDVTNLDASAIH